MSLVSYLLFLFISLIIRTLPRNLSLKIGEVIGKIIYKFFPVRKKVAKMNIDKSFPNLSEKDRLKILKDSYKHYGMVLIDFMRLKNINNSNIKDIFIIDAETKKCLENNKGAIMVTGHVGNWEYFSPLLGLNDFKFCIVAQKIKNKFLNSYFNKSRTFKNISIILKNQGTKPMIDALNKKYFLGLAADQNAGRRGLKVNFLNMKVSFPKGPSIFHIKTKKNILFSYCVMNEKNKYIFKSKVLNLDMYDYNDKNILQLITSKYSEELEKIIKQYPNQYFWFHKIQKKEIYK